MAALIEGYFDESGTFDEAPGVFCIAGYFVASDAAKKMDQEWRRVLETYELPYFHMVECAHGNGIFKDRSDRLEIELEFLSLIKKFTISGFSCFVNSSHFKVSEKFPDPYTSCAEICVTALQSYLSTHRIEAGIAYFFENGHPSKGSAYNRIANELKSIPNSSILFAEKAQIPLLQAADILAWQSAKFVKDRMQNLRPMRKDFENLLEHRHTLAYVTPGEDGISQIAFEDWPLSVRGRYTASMDINRDGPISFLMEEGETRPIIPIEKALGWRMGAGQMAYVAFQDATKKEFALAFDEVRLTEAIDMLGSAASIWSNGDLPIARAAINVGFEEKEGALILHFQTESNAVFSFSIPRTSASELAKMLVREDD